MREYRGERVDGGGTVYGFFLRKVFHNKLGDEPKLIYDKCFISCSSDLDILDVLFEPVEVKEETVSQYIGAEDKNGNKLFEKDKVTYKGKEGVFTIQYFPEYCAYGLAEEGCDKPLGRSGSSTKYEPYFLTKYHLNKIEKVEVETVNERTSI